jgi:hypothetical protein
MLPINQMCEYARYSDILEELINELHGVEVLRLDYMSDWQGFVDIDVLLEDGRVFSYKYYYGSCSGCDDWLARNLSDEEIKQEMMQEATIFSNLEAYNAWRARCRQDKKE